MTSEEYQEEPLPPEAAVALEAETYRAYHLPVETYRGLHLSDAEALAEQQGRRITVQDHLGKGRANLDTRRLRIVLDDEGRVREVAKDEDVRGLAGPPPRANR